MTKMKKSLKTLGKYIQKAFYKFAEFEDRRAMEMGKIQIEDHMRRSGLEIDELSVSRFGDPLYTADPRDYLKPMVELELYRLSKQQKE